MSIRTIAIAVVIGSFVLAINTTKAQEHNRVTPQAVRVAPLYQFAGATAGSSPYIKLVADAAGAMYGTTANGGLQSLGNVFQLTPPSLPGGRWKYAVLYSFGVGADGAVPESSLTIDAAGNLYGTTYQGGTFGYGTVFMLTPPIVPGGSWTETVLYNFQGGNDGRNPYGGVTFDNAGNLYGATQQGGPYRCGVQRYSCGTIYQLTPGPGGVWTETVLYTFQGRADGAFPDTGLAIDKAGALYGTNYYSGGYNLRYGGVVFQLAPPPQPGGAWTFATIQDFYNIGQPSFEGDLVLDAKGALYGTSWSGGTSDMGFVFQLKQSSPGVWSMKTLWNFSGADGSLPQGGVIIGKGALYGTTYSGGDMLKCNSIGCGVLFQLTPGPGGVWTETVLYKFSGGTDGAAPQGALMRGKGGAYYGTTSAGGMTGGGTIFGMK